PPARRGRASHPANGACACAGPRERWAWICAVPLWSCFPVRCESDNRRGRAPWRPAILCKSGAAAHGRGRVFRARGPRPHARHRARPHKFVRSGALEGIPRPSAKVAAARLREEAPGGRPAPGPADTARRRNMITGIAHDVSSPDRAQRAAAAGFWHVRRDGRKFMPMTNTRPIGRVIGTERQPNTPHEFRFWTAPDSDIGIGALVRVQVETPRPVTVYGVVVDGAAYTDLQTALHDYLALEGDPASDLPRPTERPEIRVYTAAVLRHEPPEPLQPVPFGPVYPASAADVAVALRMDAYAKPGGTGIPVGLYT